MPKAWVPETEISAMLASPATQTTALAVSSFALTGCPWRICPIAQPVMAALAIWRPMIPLWRKMRARQRLAG